MTVSRCYWKTGRRYGAPGQFLEAPFVLCLQMQAATPGRINSYPANQPEGVAVISTIAMQNRQKPGCRLIPEMGKELRDHSTGNDHAPC